MTKRKRYMIEILFLIFIALLLKISMKGLWCSPAFVPAEGPAGKELSQRLEGHVKKLSHEIGDRSTVKPEKLEETENYIVSELKSYGYEISKEEYEAYGVKVANIIAEKSGSEKGDEIILLGAHYDTCCNPGADDNASAVAGLLEAARFFSQRGCKRTVRFVAFVNEEPPFFKSKLMGSFVHASQARKKGEKIKAAIVLEMIGYYSNEKGSQSYPPFLGLFYPNRANFIAVVSNIKNRKLVRAVKKRFKKHSSFPVVSLVAPEALTGVDFSDHWSFWQFDYPAVMITDTSFYRYPHYHKKTDTFEKLNYPYMAEVMKGIFGVVSDFSGSDSFIKKDRKK